MDTCGLLSEDRRMVFVNSVINSSGKWVVTGYDPVAGAILAHKLGKKLWRYDDHNTMEWVHYEVFEVAGQKSVNVKPAGGPVPPFGAFMRLAGAAAEMAGQANGPDGAGGPAVT